MRRLQPRQRRHLRARLDLEDADRVGLLQQLVDGGVIGRQMREIESGSGLGTLARGSGLRVPQFDFRPDSTPGIHQLNGVLQHRHHAEAEQIDLDDAHVGAVVLVPLDDDAAGHAGGLERHDGIELALAHHHAAGVLTEMARQILDAPATARRTPACAACRSDRPAASQVARRASRSGSVNSKLCITFASRSICVLVERRAPCPLRARRCGCDR